MDRIGSTSTNTINQSYEPDSCEPLAPPADPIASCADESVDDGDGSCATSWLKGPPTAAQRYLAHLAASSESETTTAAATPSEATAVAPASAEEQLQHLLQTAAGLAVQELRSVVERTKAGESLSKSVPLGDVAKLSFGVLAEMGVNSQGNAELAYKISGSVELSYGAASGTFQINYSQTQSGEESVSVTGCGYLGLAKDFEGWFKAEARGGLCATVEDTTEAPITVTADAVLRVGVDLNLFEGAIQTHFLEHRKPLGHVQFETDLVR